MKLKDERKEEITRNGERKCDHSNGQKFKKAS